MPGEQNINWVGASGTKYLYWIRPIGTTFNNAEPGNYVFAKETPPGTYTPIYVGETGDLSERFDNHHKMPCIKLNGATHITVHKGDTSVDVRRAEEQDLKDKYNPVCND